MFYINDFYEKDKLITVATSQPKYLFFMIFLSITNEKEDVKSVYIPLINRERMKNYFLKKEI